MVLLLVCQGLLSFFIIRLSALICYLYLRICLPLTFNILLPIYWILWKMEGKVGGRKRRGGREIKRKKEGRKKKSSLLKVCVQYESVDSQWQKVGLQIININLHRLVMRRYFTFENPQILLWLSLCSRTKNSTFWFQTQLF